MKTKTKTKTFQINKNNATKLNKVFNVVKN